jgi:hypothetical protein
MRAERALGGIAVLAALCSMHRAGAAVAPPPLLPADGNTWDMFVAVQEQYDSNIYRLPPGVEPATVVSPNAEKSDGITTASAGGDGQWTPGRQVFELNLRVDENRFAHNTDLNNTSGYSNLLWNWEAGPRLSGDAAIEYNHSLASFAESRFLGRDLADTVTSYGDARIQLTPHWTVFGGINALNVSHSLPAAQYNDFHLKSGDVGLELATAVNNTFSLEYKYSRADFPTNQLAPSIPLTYSPDYTDDLLEFNVKYALTDKTLLTGYAGYRRRDFSSPLLEGFSRPVGRLELNWTPTEKTNLIFAAWHEVYAYLVSQTNYFLSNGGSIAPVWNVTEKVKLSFLASYEHQDYIPESATVILLGPLTNKITTEQASVVYTPRSSWILSLAYTHQKRDSNQILYQFADDLATGSVLYKFH